jgi:hypothetical protein
MEDYSFLRGRRKDWGEKLWSIGEWILQWDLQCTGGLQRFWARRARTSIDVLGLGVTSRQGGWFWGVLRSSIRFKRREQAADSIRVRYVNSNSWIVYLDLLLIAKFYLRKC